MDAVIAMTGHKDIKLADHYSKCDEEDQKEVSLKVMDYIREQSKILGGENGNSLEKVDEIEGNIISLFPKKVAMDH